MTTERDSLSPSARLRSLLETEGHDPERLFARLDELGGRMDKLEAAKPRATRAKA